MRRCSPWRPLKHICCWRQSSQCPPATAKSHQPPVQHGRPLSSTLLNHIRWNSTVLSLTKPKFQSTNSSTGLGHGTLLLRFGLCAVTSSPEVPYRRSRCWTVAMPGKEWPSQVPSAASTVWHHLCYTHSSWLMKSAIICFPNLWLGRRKPITKKSTTKTLSNIL